METGRVMHMTMAKRYLIELVRSKGAASILKNWRGTDEEAIARIQADKRECFPIDPDCDNQAPNGECLGHDE